MSNSGLGDALELIYAENTVLHLLSGKAVHRAIREHYSIIILYPIIICTDGY